MPVNGLSAATNKTIDRQRILKTFESLKEKEIQKVKEVLKETYVDWFTNKYQTLVQMPRGLIIIDLRNPFRYQVTNAKMFGLGSFGDFLLMLSFDAIKNGLFGFIGGVFK